VKQAVEVLILCFYCNCIYTYFAQRPIFEHSVIGVGNLPSHVIFKILSFAKLHLNYTSQTFKHNKFRINEYPFTRIDMRA